MSGWGVIPSIRVGDLPAALEYYVEQLGFGAEGEPDEPNVSLVRGDVRVMLESGEAGFYSVEYNAAIRQRLGSASPNALYMEAEDLEELNRSLLDAGARIVDPLADRPWGQAEFTIEDPFGNWLTFWKKRAPATSSS
jgi:uncharacterized glyoxalase superfamily protein PhnB